jgi:hypothetical protein
LEVGRLVVYMKEDISQTWHIFIMSLPRCERRRLGLEEDDWKLNVGSSVTLSRTRGGGNGRPDLERTIKNRVGPICVDEPEVVVVVDPTEDLVSDEEGDEDDDSTATASTVSEPTKPKHTRVIVEVSMLQQAFANYPCPKCNRKLKLKVRTLCIASSIELVCNNKECSYLCDFPRPTTTKIHEKERHKHEKMTDYALNVLFVLGFISVGDGATEAGRLLGLLGLPNDTTMMARSFGVIEERIGPLMREICSEILIENMNEEARRSMNEFDYNVWKMWVADPTMGDMPVERMPQIDATYDMAWQQKGSGHVYNSQSGHGTLFGRHTRKIIGLVIKSKLCCYCNTFTKKHPGEEVPEHVCWKNHEGSSGSMESSGAVQVVVDAFEQRKVVIRRLCCDDDSSIRADCRWSNADYMKNNNTDVLPMVKKQSGKNKGKLQPRPDKGKLPAHVPEPLFVADPNHRRKGLNGELIELDKAKVADRFTMTRMDSIRIAKNFGYMARTLKDKDESEYVDAAKACLEHHFDNHEYCGSWCRRKDESEEDKTRGIKYYRCKVKDAKLYTALSSKLDRFVSKERLCEMAHTLDTNMNEAFNQICTWFAPKNKVFAGTGSLHNRIAFAVGINSLGVEAFFRRLFKKLGIPLTDNVAYYLKLKEKYCVTRLEAIKTNEAKRKKNKKKLDKLSEHTKLARIERRKREGTYRRGMNLDDPDDDGGGKPPAAKRSKRSNVFCEYCGASDHATRRSLKCTQRESSVKNYRRADGTLLSGPPAVPREDDSEEQEQDAAALLLAANDCSAMELIPWNADYSSDTEDQTPAFLLGEQAQEDPSAGEVVVVGGTL